jgi:hypothetical protein
LSKGAALGLKKGTVLWYAQQIYRQHGVASLKELLIKHGKPTRPHMRGKGGSVENVRLSTQNSALSTDLNPPPMTKEVRRRLLAGESIAHIAAETGAGKMLIYNQRQALRKGGTKLVDGRMQNGGKPQARTAGATPHRL